jgi:hypothetical protein
MSFKINSLVTFIHPYPFPHLLFSCEMDENKVYKVIQQTLVGDTNTRIFYLLYAPNGTSHQYYNGTNPGWWFEEKYLKPASAQLMLFEL